MSSVYFKCGKLISLFFLWGFFHPIFSQTLKSLQVSEMEQQILIEMNKVRTDPQTYAKEVIAPIVPLYKEKIFSTPGQVDMVTQEGVKPVKELYHFLLKAKPIGPLTISSGLTLAARTHAREQGTGGMIGHQSANGEDPFERMSKYGRYTGQAGENISYGPKESQRIVLQLLIDDGVPSRGHRKNIMNPDFKVCGIGFERHKKWRYVTVIDYASEFHTNL